MDYKGCSVLIGVYVLLVVVAVFIVTVMWSWVVPDVFSGAVAAGLLPTSITLWQAFKLSLIIAALGLNRASGGK